MTSTLWLLMIGYLLIGNLPAQLEPEADPELEKRVLTFSQRVRCLVCQNETLADSRAELAADLRQEIREQMKAGRSDEEITLFLLARYGDFVLYQPPLKPSTYALWFGPFLLLSGGLIALHRCVKRLSRTSDPEIRI